MISIAVMISLGLIVGWNLPAIFGHISVSNTERTFAILQVVIACIAWWYIEVLAEII